LIQIKSNQKTLNCINLSLNLSLGALGRKSAYYRVYNIIELATNFSSSRRRQTFKTKDSTLKNSNSGWCFHLSRASHVLNKKADILLAEKLRDKPLFQIYLSTSDRSTKKQLTNHSLANLSFIEIEFYRKSHKSKKIYHC
jgi:hypothetical protein